MKLRFGNLSIEVSHQEMASIKKPVSTVWRSCRAALGVSAIVLLTLLIIDSTALLAKAIPKCGMLVDSSNNYFADNGQVFAGDACVSMHGDTYLRNKTVVGK